MQNLICNSMVLLLQILFWEKQTKTQNLPQSNTLTLHIRKQVFSPADQRMEVRDWKHKKHGLQVDGVTAQGMGAVSGSEEQHPADSRSCHGPTATSNRASKWEPRAANTLKADVAYMSRKPSQRGSDFHLQNCELVSECCLKLPSLRSFVTQQ